jgi:hypothetical protein
VLLYESEGVVKTHLYARNKKGSSPLSHSCSLYHAKKVQHVEMIYSLSRSTVPKLKFKLKFCACESI